MQDELLLTYTSYNGQNLNSPAVSVIRGSTVSASACRVKTQGQWVKTQGQLVKVQGQRAKKIKLNE
jgi:hypothetical protein